MNQLSDRLNSLSPSATLAMFLRGMVVGMLAWFHALVRKERSSSMIYVFRKKKSEKTVE